MKRWVVLMLSLMVLLSIGADSSTNSGCSSGGSTSASANKVDPYIGGTSGLAIQFEEGYPPAEVYDKAQYPFDIDVKLENVGEYSIGRQDVVVKISGIKPEDFGVSENQLIVEGVNEDLIPTRKDAEGNVIEGNPVHVVFSNLNFQRQLDGNFNPPLRADVCYKYGTNSVSDICVIENVLVEDSEAVCKVNENKVVFNSGAPIQIADFKEVARGEGKIGFSFAIKHKGTGKIYAPGTKCAEDLAGKNRVNVEINTGIEGLTCTGLSGTNTGSGEAILYNGERTITCTQPVSGKLSYTSRVEIKLQYDYKEDVSTNILVKYSQ